MDNYAGQRKTQQFTWNPKMGSISRKDTVCLQALLVSLGPRLFLFLRHLGKPKGHPGHFWGTLPPTNMEVYRPLWKGLLSSWKGALCTSMLVGGRVLQPVGSALFSSFFWKGSPLNSTYFAPPLSGTAWFVASAGMWAPLTPIGGGGGGS